MPKARLAQTAFAVRKFSQLVEKLSEGELEKWRRGEAELVLKVRRPRRARVAASQAKPISPKEYRELREKFFAASSRESCAALVDSSLPQRKDLEGFYKFMGWRASSGYSKERLRRNIVENTAGAKLDSDAIQSHFS